MGKTRGAVYRPQSTNEAGLRSLRPLGGPLQLAPGAWALSVSRYGLGDAHIVGESDKMVATVAGLAKTELTRAGRVDEAADAADVKHLEDTFRLAESGALARRELALTLKMMRGEEPVHLRETLEGVLGELPAGSIKAAVKALLKGDLLEVGTALTMLVLLDTVDEVVESLFGESVLLAQRFVLESVAAGDAEASLCVARLPDFDDVNVGDRRDPTNFALDAEGRLLETAGVWHDYAESPDHPGWVFSPQPYALVSLSRE